MRDPAAQASPPFLLSETDFARLLDALRDDGYQLIGPRRRDQVIAFHPIDGLQDLPRNLVDQTAPGRYRIAESDTPSRFAFHCGPNSLKSFLFPPRRALWQAERDSSSLRFAEPTPTTPRFAFVGARPCDLKAVAIQDRVFLHPAYRDTDYQRRRQNAFFLAVNCLQTGPNCFCPSAGAGPRATEGFDIALTEQAGNDDASFLAEAGSSEGEAFLDALGLPAASQARIDAAENALARAASRAERSLDFAATAEALERAIDSPRWDAIEQRCLACANCTLVCPTCFCSTVEDRTNLDGNRAERQRTWDSCFQLSHSYVAGGPVRPSLKGRYRQWLTHKLSTWPAQFDTLGCVGCGRCIAWCPAGIDLLQEARALCAEAELRSPPTPNQGTSP